MKKLALLLLAFCSGAFAGPDDMIFTQRNSLDTGNVTRIPAHPMTPGLFHYDSSTLLPSWVTLGSGLTISSGVLALTSVPVNPDWNAVSGLAQILNKPTVPAAQVNSDWASASGVSQILNKPTIPAAQVNSDWAAGSGVAVILNKPTLATVATSGSYADLTNTPTSPSQSAASRSLNSAFQVSATRAVLVSYSVQITTTASIGSGQDGDVVLEIASNSGFSSNVQTLAISGSSQTYTLAVAIQGVQKVTAPVVGWVPAGYYVRLRTVQNTGTATFSYRAGQEILF